MGSSGGLSLCCWLAVRPGPCHWPSLSPDKRSCVPSSLLHGGEGPRLWSWTDLGSHPSSLYSRSVTPGKLLHFLSLSFLI